MLPSRTVKIMLEIMGSWKRRTNGSFNEDILACCTCGTDAVNACLHQLWDAGGTHVVRLVVAVEDHFAVCCVEARESFPLLESALHPVVLEEEMEWERTKAWNPA